MSVGLAIILSVLAVLVAICIRQGQPWAPIVRRFIEQAAMLVPRMIAALVAAGFIAATIPNEFISHYLGPEFGFYGILVGTLAGLIVPSGPVISFSIAAVFAKSGASVPALVAFITSWSVFAAHRILIYEVPMLGMDFLRLRIVSACILPILAGAIAMLIVEL